MGNEEAILIAGLSGRALAASARRGGYAPLVADFFGDQDTLAVAQAHVRLAGSLSRGIEEDALIEALEVLSRGRSPLGIVCGSGFEDRTALLERLSGQWRLFGNGAETVAKTKSPELLSALCADAGIAFPRSEAARPLAATDWLEKRRGGAGGSHIRPATQSDSSRSNGYYQEKLNGVPVSALFLADGENANVLGYSWQWSSPTALQPYRYGGAVRPAELSPTTAAGLADTVHRLAASLSLVGLNSADFLVDGDLFWLLEINPRPGATLDIFEPPQGSLFAMHIAACTGTLTAQSQTSDAAEAAAIVYAEADIPAVPALVWPDWTADRPTAGSMIKAGEPLCTVYACGPAASGARVLVEERRELILAWTGAGKSQ